MKNKTKNKQQLYGVFYKNRGEWTGPYYGLTYNGKENNNLLELLEDCKYINKKSTKIVKV